MAKIIVNIKNIRNTTPFKVKVNGEIVESLSQNNTLVSEIEYGEHEIQLYGNFLGKTVKRKVYITEKEVEFKITLNYKLCVCLFVIHVIMTLLIMKFPQYALFIVFPIVFFEFLSLIVLGMFDLKEINKK